jgi:putative ABC transport system ATP-binding protein
MSIPTRVFQADLVRNHAEAVFEARGLTKVYHMGEVDVHALRGVDLELYPGELVVLLGPSGSGKSTLLNILGGLDIPSGGTVRYREKDLTAASDAALTRYRREHVGFVFQFYNLIPNLTARENVELASQVGRDPLPIDEVMASVGLSDRVANFPSQLSGGEQQRVAIARALAKNPKLLLCDEPTGALDYNTGRSILKLLQETCRTRGITVVVITHNLALMPMGNKVIKLKSGLIEEIVDNDTPVGIDDLEW